MILPTKHENLSNSSLSIGATLLKKLKSKSYVIEDLYELARDKHGISLVTFFDIMLFLWLCGLVEMNDYEVRISERVA